MEERAHLQGCFPLKQPNLDLQTSFAQDVCASATHVWVWIRMSDDHPLNARPKQGFCAWRCASKMVARFKGHVRGGSVGGHATGLGIMDGHLFSVKPAKVVVPPFCDGYAVLHEHATHGWVRADATLTSLSDLKGPPHEISLAFRPHRDGGGFCFSHMSPRLWARTFILFAPTHRTWLKST